MKKILSAVLCTALLSFSNAFALVDPAPYDSEDECSNQKGRWIQYPKTGPAICLRSTSPDDNNNNVMNVTPQENAEIQMLASNDISVVCKKGYQWSYATPANNKVLGKCCPGAQIVKCVVNKCVCQD